ncbi:MAG: nuclear transport factor 2 family protein [Gemmatimonadetes bacterium]|nr:nuclear transport factor 2 family protein [Gemmatimonadota bacterium]
MRRRSIALVVLVLALAASRAHAQDLDQVLDRFAASWAKGDAVTIAQLVARGGMSIDIDGTPIGPLSRRQAAALLRRIFDDRETVVIRAGSAQVVGGAPPRAFGEIAWSARSRGTTIPERATVFLALVREDDGWRITQIRVLR